MDYGGITPVDVCKYAVGGDDGAFHRCSRSKNLIKNLDFCLLIRIFANGKGYRYLQSSPSTKNN